MIDLLGEQEQMPGPEVHVRIKVTNRNNRIIKDRFNGVPYTFKPNEPVILTREEAAHFFGWPGDEDVRAVYMAKRFGWHTAEYVKPEPMAGPDGPPLYRVYAANFVIETEEYELVPKNKATLADDGLAIETMPTMQTPRPDAAGAAESAKVGVRKGSPVKLGGRRGRKKAHEPADPGLIPL